jgi:hypothetical protein
MADYWKEMNEPPPVAGAPTTEFLVPTNAKLVREMRTGAAWLFAFAGFTVVNDIFGLIHAPIRMVVGLMTSEYVLAIGRSIGGSAIPIGYALSALMAVAVGVVGAFAYRFAIWAFWAGIALVAVDAAINYFVTTLAGVWPFILHFAALWFLFLGLKAARLHAERRAAGKA